MSDDRQSSLLTSLARFKFNLKFEKSRNNYVDQGSWVELNEDWKKIYDDYTATNGKGVNVEARYQGEWENNQCEGLGLIQDDCGNCYKGPFSKGRKVGPGKFVWEWDEQERVERVRYRGDWREDLQNGYGVYDCYEFSYEGEWVDGNFGSYGVKKSKGFGST